MSELFKAKRVDNGEWVEGYYLKKHGVPFIYETRECPQSNYEVYETTLCQYTGLTDRDGNKIWENDILRANGNPNDLAKVVFGEFGVIDIETLGVIDDVNGWHTEVIETDYISTLKPFCYSMPLTDFYIKRCKFEVIGNIFDDSELLKNPS